ncbi:MAG TPA: glycine zipper 2TM domain-containing protein [Steroidobacteraceae bacterium]|nr:glycine zipper 2TM domain-containing protein [Gammaproteobacteria bacterium]HEV2284774.1 glycine zipper 2TM domain-containing protein [Steroidobacteraceae bacterium]
MDKSLVTGLVIGAAVAAGAGALAGLKLMNKGPAYAEVLSVTPLTRSIRTPRQECHDEQVTRQAPVKDEHQVLGTIAGAVIGGVVGHQIGGGSGRDIATVAAAAGGGYAGNRIQKNLQDRDTVTSTEQKCATVYDSAEKITGYQVRYRLNGKESTVRMDHDPGPHIPLRDGQPDLTAAVPGKTT